MIVIADTSPINYLILIGKIDILPALYDTILVPPEVLAELTQPKAPDPVRVWAQQPPSWLVVRPVTVRPDFLRHELDPGEAAALSLAIDLGAELVIIDEEAGRAEASLLGLRLIGTLGVLREAHRAGLLDLAQALDALQATTFRVRASLIRSLLDAI